MNSGVYLLNAENSIPVRMDISMGMTNRIIRIVKWVIPIAALLALVMPTQISAQNFSGAFEGMQDSDKPIQISADRLEVKDKKGTAVFSGNVEVVQGTTILKAKRMKVTYTRGDKTPDGNLKYIEATGEIAVRSGDQKATAERGDFNMLKQTVKLSGNVIISQGSNLVFGCILEVNLRTSSATLKPCKNKGRPIILFDPKNAPRKK